MKISLITPVYNESKTIDNFLEQLENLPGDWEILFADGGSQDDTCTKIGARYPLLHAPKGRANQMNFAAEKATGDWLWFVHCDSQLPANAHSLISEAARQGALWGCFRIGFDYHGPFMGCNAFFSNLRATRKIPFGDQGIFVRRDIFETMSGFPDLPIMEDYEFSRRMKAAGHPFRQTAGTIITSGRRYANKLPLITMWQMFYLRCLYRRGVDIQEIARRYRDIR